MPGNILGAMNTIVNKYLTSQNLDSRFWSFLDVRVPFKYIQIENSVFLILFLSFFFFLIVSFLHLLSFINSISPSRVQHDIILYLTMEIEVLPIKL